MKSTLLKKTVVTPISFSQSLAWFWRPFHPTKYTDARSKYSPCHAAIAVSFSNYSRHRRPPAIGILMEVGEGGYAPARTPPLLAFNLSQGLAKSAVGCLPFLADAPWLRSPLPDANLCTGYWIPVDRMSGRASRVQTAPRTHRRRNNYGVCLQSSFFFSLSSPRIRGTNSEQRNRVRKLKIILKWAGNLFQSTITNHIKQE